MRTPRLNTPASCLAIFACFLFAGSGCRLAQSTRAEVDELLTVSQTAPKGVRMVYRTKTDRLNLAGADLPPCSMATLYVQSPHPSMKVDSARVELIVVPSLMDDELTPPSTPASAEHAVLARQYDVPLWQVESVMKHLHDENFFRRAKTLWPEVYVAVNTGEKQLGKPYRAVPEFDAMILRAAAAPQSSGVPTPATRPELARLPALAR